MKRDLLGRTKQYDPNGKMGREAGIPPTTLGIGEGKQVKMVHGPGALEVFYLTTYGPYIYPSTEEEIEAAYECAASMRDPVEVGLGEYDVNGQFYFVPAR